MAASDDDRGEGLGALLSQLLTVVLERETPILRAHGVTMWEYVILDRLVGETALTQKELARRSRRDPTRLIGHLDALGDRCLIARETDESDRRRRTVRLTDEGRELVLAIRHDVSRMEADLLGVLPVEGRDELRRALELVLRSNSPSDTD